MATSAKDPIPPSAIRLASKVELLQRIRPDLRGFDLTTLDGRAGFLGWWIGFCAGRWWGVDRPSDQASADLALSPVSPIEEQAELPITHMLLGVWQGTQQFWTPRMTLDDPLGRLTTTVHWYLYWPVLVPGYALRYERVEAFLATPIGSDERTLSLMPAEYLAWRQWYNSYELDWGSPQLRANELRCWYYLSAATGRCPHRCILPRGLPLEDLQAQLGHLAPMALAENKWLSDNVGLAERDLTPVLENELPAVIARHEAKVRTFDELPRPLFPVFPRKTVRGANIIGHVTGELGIGEDARMTGASLQRFGYPFSMYSYAPGSSARQENLSFAARIRSDNPHDQNIFCLSAVETMMAKLELPEAFFEGRRNIGYMPWELAMWPESFTPLFDWMDEVWTISSFVTQGIRAVSRVPVSCMPPAVVTERPAASQRREFGLPEDRFLFLFVFDFGSSIYRKNPEACLEAFQRAFMACDRRAGLVFKCMNARREMDRFQQFVARCQADDRVFLMTHTMTRGEILDLIACCDVFVSLHRAEGFGRCIAEAMALGKPVIATGYSGNLDFCFPDTACLVRFSEVPVPEEQYWHSAGQSWAEPDVDHAAEWMLRLFEDGDFARAIASAGQHFVQERYSPIAAGTRYLERLLAK